VSAQRANWNVVSTADYDGKVLERVRLTPYGQPTFDAETANGDYDGDGDTDSADYNTLVNTCLWNYSGACRIFDYDDNRVINIGDIFDFLALYPAATTVQRQPGRRTSPNHFPHVHQGLYLDEETMTYQNRYRQYAPQQSRFMQRDPLGLQAKGGAGYQDGMSQYSYFRQNPSRGLDYLGLAAVVECPCDCGEPCQRADQRGLDVNEGRPSAGGVICCNGKKFACAWPGNLPSIQNAPAVIQCIIQHEIDHFDDVTCPNDKFFAVCCPPLGIKCEVSRPDFDAGVDQDQAECHAYSRELQCLTRKLETCSEPGYCPNVVAAIDLVLEQMRDLGC